LENTSCSPANAQWSLNLGEQNSKCLIRLRRFTLIGTIPFRWAVIRTQHAITSALRNELDIQVRQLRFILAGSIIKPVDDGWSPAGTTAVGGIGRDGADGRAEVLEGVADAELRVLLDGWA